MIGSRISFMINGHFVSGTVLSFDMDTIYVQVATEIDGTPDVFALSTSSWFELS